MWILVTVGVNDCANLNHLEANKTNQTPPPPKSSHSPRAVSGIGTYGICLAGGIHRVDEFPWNFKSTLQENTMLLAQLEFKCQPSSIASTKSYLAILTASTETGMVCSSSLLQF